MLTTPWLSPEEIADLCDGLTQAAAQARYLKKAFGIECKRKPSGALLVFRYQLDPKTPAQRTRTEPNRAALLALVGKRA